MLIDASFKSLTVAGMERDSDPNVHSIAKILRDVDIVAEFGHDALLCLKIRVWRKPVSRGRLGSFGGDHRLDARGDVTPGEAPVVSTFDRDPKPGFRVVAFVHVGNLTSID